MVYNVTCYKNTGFTKGNIPSSPAVLETAEKVELQTNQVWKLQDRLLSRIKLQMDWYQAYDIDYIKINDAYYTVESVEQTNKVAVFTLAMDPINSVGGVGGFTLVDGWVERCSSESDALFGNILDEPWSPKKELVMDPIAPLNMTTTGANVTVIGSTVNLGALKYEANQYVDAATNSSVTVPKIPEIAEETELTIGGVEENDVPSSWSVTPQKLPNLELFYFDNDTIKESVQVVRSLGLTDCITCCYQLPTRYCLPVGSPATPYGYSQVKSRIENIPVSSLKYKYGNYVPKNNKVYALHNNYNLLGAASGDRQEYRARELYAGGEQPNFYIYCDPSPDGKPYAQPTYYEGRQTLVFQEAVAGANWLTTPMTLYRPEGWAQSLGEHKQDYQDFDRRLNRFAIDTVQSGVGNILKGDVGGVINTVKEGAYGLQDITREMARAQFDFESQMQIVTPEIRFGRGAEIAGYVFNGFIVYRTRLSDEDMENFDNFLTAYGYADSRKLKQSDFTSHQHFNFVQASNVSVKGVTKYMADSISEYFKGGVRLWHELPNLAAMTDNPIKTGGAA